MFFLLVPSLGTTLSEEPRGRQFFCSSVVSKTFCGPPKNDLTDLLCDKYTSFFPFKNPVIVNYSVCEGHHSPNGQQTPVHNVAEMKLQG